MKYLKLHKVLWFVLVFIYTTIELFMFLIFASAYFIWNLKILKWNQVYRGRSDWDWHDYADKNIFETFNRNYNVFNR